VSVTIRRSSTQLVAPFYVIPIPQTMLTAESSGSELQHMVAEMGIVTIKQSGNAPGIAVNG
jgi:hypothetical protein